jgi:hypothetical protein
VSEALGRLNGTTYRDRYGVYAWKGERFTSVTTVLGAMAKPALPYWAAKCVAEHVAERAGALGRGEIKGPALLAELADVDSLKKVPWAKRDKKADVGTQVHLVAELTSAGRAVDPGVFAEDVRPYIVSFLEWEARWQPEYFAMEAPVFSRSRGYAGTMDAICRIGGRTIVMDYKTGADTYAEHALQLAAYRHGEYLGLPDGTEYPMPATEAGAILLISPEGCKLLEWPTGQPEMEVFEAMIPVQRWQRATKDLRPAEVRYAYSPA